MAGRNMRTTWLPGNMSQASIFVMPAAAIWTISIVALIAYSIVTKADVEAEGAALSTAFGTVCANRLIKRMAERFMGQVDEGLGAVIRQRKGEIREELQMELSGEHVIKDIAVQAADRLIMHPRGLANYATKRTVTASAAQRRTLAGRA